MNAEEEAKNAGRRYRKVAGLLQTGDVANRMQRGQNTAGGREATTLYSWNPAPDRAGVRADAFP